MVDPENTSFSTVDGVLFDYKKTTLMAYPGAKAGDYVIPEKVTTLAQYAFSGATQLTNVRLPKTITAIPNGAFFGCTSLEKVNIPEKVNNIGSFAFSECASLSAVKVAWSTPLSLLADAFRNTYIEDAKLYVPEGKKTVYSRANIWKQFGEIKEYPNCDVNGDGLADMLDAVDIVKFVVDTPAEEFDEFLADFDEDELVTAADAVRLLNMLADGSAAPNIASAPMKMIEGDEHVGLTLDPNGVISLSLDNVRRYSAFQFDLTLSEGSEVSLAQLTERKNGHQLVYNKVGENTYRFVAISLSGNSFRDFEGTLLNIMAGSRDAETVSATNIRMITSDGVTYLFEDVLAAMPTDIAEVMTQGNSDADAIYNLSGMRVERAGKGVYIVNGKKVIIK